MTNPLSPSLLGESSPDKEKLVESGAPPAEAVTSRDSPTIPKETSQPSNDTAQLQNPEMECVEQQEEVQQEEKEQEEKEQEEKEQEETVLPTSWAGDEASQSQGSEPGTRASTPRPEAERSAQKGAVPPSEDVVGDQVEPGPGSAVSVDSDHPDTYAELLALLPHTKSAASTAGGASGAKGPGGVRDDLDGELVASFTSWAETNLHDDAGLAREAIQFMQLLGKKRRGEINPDALERLTLPSLFNHFDNLLKALDSAVKRQKTLRDELQTTRLDLANARDQVDRANGMLVRLEGLEGHVKQLVEQKAQKDEHVRKQLDLLSLEIDEITREERRDAGNKKEGDKILDKVIKLGNTVLGFQANPDDQEKPFDRKAVQGRLDRLYSKEETLTRDMVKTRHEEVLGRNIELEKEVFTARLDIKQLQEQVEALKNARGEDQERLMDYETQAAQTELSQHSAEHLAEKCSFLETSVRFYRTEGEYLQKYRARYEQLAAATNDADFKERIGKIMDDIPVDSEALARRKGFNTALQGRLDKLEEESGQETLRLQQEVSRLRDELKKSEGGLSSRNVASVSKNKPRPGPIRIPTQSRSVSAMANWPLATPLGSAAEMGPANCTSLAALFRLEIEAGSRLEEHITRPTLGIDNKLNAVTPRDWANLWSASEFRLLRAAAFAPLRFAGDDPRWDWHDTITRAVRLREWVGLVWPCRREARFMPAQVRDEMRAQADIVYAMVQLWRPRRADADFFGTHRARDVLRPYLTDDSGDEPQFSEGAWVQTWWALKDKLRDTFADLDAEERALCRCGRRGAGAWQEHGESCPVAVASARNTKPRESTRSGGALQAGSVGSRIARELLDEPDVERLVSWGEWDEEVMSKLTAAVSPAGQASGKWLLSA